MSCLASSVCVNLLLLQASEVLKASATCAYCLIISCFSTLYGAAAVVAAAAVLAACPLALLLSPALLEPLLFVTVAAAVESGRGFLAQAKPVDSASGTGPKSGRRSATRGASLNCWTRS